MISILVAYTKNKRVIGAQGKIPWKLSSERNRFKQICSGKYVIMGRKSYEEIGHPLSYCNLVIISSKRITSPAARNETHASVLPEFCDAKLAQGIHLCTSVEAAINYCKNQGQDELLIAGGGSVYEQALPYTDKIYATEIEADFDGDVFFPEINPEEWKETVEAVHNENGIEFKYITLERKADLQ